MIRRVAATCLLSTLIGAPASAQTPNALTPEERAAGWTLLFDGKTTAGWRGFQKPAFPADGWAVEDGALKCLGRKGGDILTTETFLDFELAWEWRLSPKANTGIKYFVNEKRGNTTGAIGHEYQIIDDAGYDVEPLSAKQKTGGWYDVIPPKTIPTRPIGEWNQSRVIVRGTHVEHWLNGTLVVSYDTNSAESAAGIAASKFKDVAGYADKIPTPILLQDHNTVAWFRNLKIRELPAPGAAAPAQPPLAMLPGKVYHSAQIPYKGDDTKKARRFFYGTEQSGYALEMHETVLGPGVETHPPHVHPHQEIIIVLEGTVEVSMDGKVQTVEAGSVIFYDPNKPHNLRNAGTTPCRYYVVELRGRNALSRLPFP
jgi:quercetin dioxygenase-like cupin family protein